MERNVIVMVVIAGLFYLAGQYVASQPQRVQQEVEANRELTVQGVGEATVVPDVAKYTLGVRTGTLPTAEAAVQQLTDRFNAVAEAVRAQGVAEEDLKTTNLSINPVYDFPQDSGTRVLRGFEASESIEVTIRDLSSIGDILATATVEGVNQAGGIRFEVDDIEQVKLEAQERAIEDAREKAEQLARAMDVRLGTVKSFSAADGGGPTPVFARAETLDAVGGPEVPVGTQDVTSSVTIVYELR